MGKLPWPDSRLTYLGVKRRMKVKRAGLCAAIIGGDRVSAGVGFLNLSGITRVFGRFRAVDNLSLSIERGEIFSLLGPSGCGKSTTLRLIAGLDQPDGGEITLNGTVLYSATSGTFLPTQKRNMGMVFQSYAIWPHLSVFDTVAYPLAVRKVPRAQIAERVSAMLRLVGLEGYETRLAPMLSGGQQQRVALARALVYEPDVLLLDEPFSNLDVQLREQMRLELKLLQRRVGVTVILVTHDQHEALSLSHRIAVIQGGRVEQLATPYELYERPATPFVRDFIGASLKLSGKLIRDNAVELPDGTVIEGRAAGGEAATVGAPALASIRPETIVVTSEGGANTVAATIVALLFIGDRYECVLEIGGAEVPCFLPRVTGQAPYAEGSRIHLHLPPDSVSLWRA
jgi:ABC-type Fe3+/spermidine/putrescine transport system ATPase subunit